MTNMTKEDFLAILIKYEVRVDLYDIKATIDEFPFPLLRLEEYVNLLKNMLKKKYEGYMNALHNYCLIDDFDEMENTHVELVNITHILYILSYRIREED